MIIQYLSFIPPTTGQQAELEEIFGTDIEVVVRAPTTSFLDLKIDTPVVVQMDSPGARLSERLHNAGFNVWRPQRIESRSVQRPWEPIQRLTGYGKYS